VVYVLNVSLAAALVVIQLRISLRIRRVDPAASGEGKEQFTRKRQKQVCRDNKAAALMEQS
jgi:hypothetical protein